MCTQLLKLVQAALEEQMGWGQAATPEVQRTPLPCAFLFLLQLQLGFRHLYNEGAGFNALFTWLFSPWASF